MTRFIAALSLISGLAVVAGCANDKERDHTSPMYTAEGPSDLTQTCAYNTGPLAGQTIDYSGTPGVSAVRVGNRCADMHGSSGTAVAQRPSREQGGRFYSSPNAPSAWGAPGAPNTGSSLICRFTSGPAAGHTADYSSTLGARPAAIGSTCSDGPNRGFVVAQ